MINDIFEMYRAKSLSSNSICINCRNANKIQLNPIGPWLICSKNVSNRLMFVGKVARNDKMGELINNVENVVNFGEDYLLDKSNNRAYWKYTYEILLNVFPNIDEALDCTTFTNIIKCNNGSTKDETSDYTKQCCIRDNKIIWEEIEIIKPKVLVFYTNTYYDYYINQFMPSNVNSYIDIYDYTHNIQIGNKMMPWWERVFYDQNNEVIMSLLRVGHPERLNKKDFVNALSTWIDKHLASSNKCNAESLP